MLSGRAIKAWSWLHKWSSLVCTLFMLLLCLTGLPLIFHHEIDQALGHEVRAAEMPQDAPRASLDQVLGAALARYPGRVVQFASLPADDDRVWSVTLAPTPAPTFDFKSVQVDARTGAVIGEAPVGQGFMDLMLRLHTDLLAGLRGKLFLGLMGLLFLLALISGAVLYAPFMRKLDFGQVRHGRAARIRWLDLHNLLGIATLVWALVVGATGMINTWAELLLAHWQNDQLAALVAPYKGQPLIAQAQRGPVQASYDAVLSSVPGMRLAFVAFPGTPLTAKLLQPVLVDARTGAVTAVPPLPWYLSALLLSQPLHFGDYGGLPMKLLWALLDLVTVIVLGSGLYLWCKRGATRPGSSGAAPARIGIAS